jgi:hypothetical protein
LNVIGSPNFRCFLDYKTVEVGSEKGSLSVLPCEFALICGPITFL